MKVSSVALFIFSGIFSLILSNRVVALPLTDWVPVEGKHFTKRSTITLDKGRAAVSSISGKGSSIEEGGSEVNLTRRNDSSSDSEGELDSISKPERSQGYEARRARVAGLFSYLRHLEPSSLRLKPERAGHVENPIHFDIGSGLQSSQSSRSDLHSEAKRKKKLKAPLSRFLLSPQERKGKSIPPPQQPFESGQNLEMLEGQSVRGAGSQAGTFRGGTNPPRRPDKGVSGKATQWYDVPIRYMDDDEFKGAMTLARMGGHFH
ncbi:hypothetical protein IE53DRAFT_243839 [Violaceomyces palustris]|uniref:Uncharacterized protein n=1 Tax=Violaceomyces palustris TaxID=1673888 RepID=A0ACD0NP70_9BASI|nr:hypothetical protein IE53DRAFT_243839 [Violaceomyces palustris]